MDFAMIMFWILFVVCYIAGTVVLTYWWFLLFFKIYRNLNKEAFKKWLSE